MDLDELRQEWTAHGAALERSLLIDERLLREVLLRKVRFALAPYVFWRALEVVLGVAALLVLVPLLCAHAGEPLYLAAGGATALFAFGLVALSAVLLVRGLRLDYGAPVTAIQRDVERIRLVEYRAIKCALLGGVLLWLPAALLLFEAATGVPALARVELPWLAGNLALGLVVLAVGQVLSARYVERSGMQPWARRIVEAFTGRSLRAAQQHLEELSGFVHEERRG